MERDEAELDPRAEADETNAELAGDRDARERKAAADSLRRQIEQLKKGRPPRSLNEFAEQQMAEDTEAREHSPGESGNDGA